MRNVLAVFALAGLTFCLQRIATSGSTEYSLYADEPAHYVTGLMFTEYIRQGFPGSPIRFAEQYYVHYPKVAIGSWPPVFYGVQALWSLPFGSSKASLYCLIAAILSMIAICIFLLTRRTLGTAGAVLLGAVFILLPITQELLPMMMADSLVTLLTLTATVWFARYWETGRYRDAVIYAVLAGATVLTKGSGVSLALIPVCAIVLTQRWKMVLAKPLWVAAVIVAVLGGPWTVLTLRIVQDGWQQEKPLSSYLIDALWRVPWWHAENLTFAVTAVMLAGVWRMTRSENRPNSPLLIAAASTVLAVLIFHILTPVGMEARRIYMAIPPSLLLAAQGIVWLRERLPARLQLAPALVLALITALVGLPPVKKPHFGYDQTAEYLHSKADWTDCVTLVSSEHEGEGLLISEMAVREHVAKRYILRASKMLASASWNATDYKLKMQGVEDLARYLEKPPVNVIVLDTYRSPAYRYPHHEMLWSVLAKNAQWEKVAEFAGKDVKGAISVYKHRTKACVPNPVIEVDLTRKIQRSVSN